MGHPRSLDSHKLIDEKILQRFVFEKFYSSSEERKKLLPQRLHKLANESSYREAVHSHLETQI